MAKLDSLCVYCASSDLVETRFKDAAARMGRILAERGVRLVFGGGHVGLMGVAADAALAHGGQVIGIIPEHLTRYEVAHQGATRLIVTDSMHSRKAQMFELSDAFAILPGGLGTLDETLEIITWKQIRLHDKPIVIVNVDGYWDPLIELIEHVIAHRFARESTRDLYTVVDSVDDVFPAIAAAPEPTLAAEVERT
jgi:uncharacterized protein (TIGR00730 family)